MTLYNGHPSFEPCLGTVCTPRLHFLAPLLKFQGPRTSIIFVVKGSSFSLLRPLSEHVSTGQVNKGFNQWWWCTGPHKTHHKCVVVATGPPCLPLCVPLVINCQYKSLPIRLSIGISAPPIELSTNSAKRGAPTSFSQNQSSVETKGRKC